MKKKLVLIVFGCCMFFILGYVSGLIMKSDIGNTETILCVNTYDEVDNFKATEKNILSLSLRGNNYHQMNDSMFYRKEAIMHSDENFDLLFLR